MSDILLPFQGCPNKVFVCSCDYIITTCLYKFVLLVPVLPSAANLKPVIGRCSSSRLNCWYLIGLLLVGLFEALKIKAASSNSFERLIDI